MYHGRLNSAVSPSIFYSRLEHRHRTLHATYWRVVDSTNSIHRSTRPDPKLVSMRRHASIVLGSSPLPLLHAPTLRSTSLATGRYHREHHLHPHEQRREHQALRQTVQQRGPPLLEHVPRGLACHASRCNASALATPRPTHRALEPRRARPSAGRTSRTMRFPRLAQGDVVRGVRDERERARFGTRRTQSRHPDGSERARGATLRRFRHVPRHPHQGAPDDAGRRPGGSPCSQMPVVGAVEAQLVQQVEVQSDYHVGVFCGCNGSLLNAGGAGYPMESVGAAETLPRGSWTPVGRRALLAPRDPPVNQVEGLCVGQPSSQPMITNGYCQSVAPAVRMLPNSDRI